ncbi:hypothetical protein VZC37_22920 [Gordonia sp. LSe1-13]|uniref:Uncharacterized protein n=1 Tax=Gordonia sesuvii TaxID=3116777 RepID=A0ABU7MK43_9ACTN|nr:hypothetical protein [Gordonia sp. LSe1-13]
MTRRSRSTSGHAAALAFTRHVGGAPRSARGLVGYRVSTAAAESVRPDDPEPSPPSPIGRLAARAVLFNPRLRGARPR